MQNTEETIEKYAVDANLFRLGSANPKKKYPAPGFFIDNSTVGGIFPVEFSRWNFPRWNSPMHASGRPVYTFAVSRNKLRG